MKTTSKVCLLKKKIIKFVWKLVTTEKNEKLRIFSRTEYPYRNIKVINETKLLETIKTYNNEMLTTEEVKEAR